MKTPKYPNKPYPPYKPIPPLEKIDHKKIIDSFELDKYTDYSLDNIKTSIETLAPNINIKDIKLEFKIEEKWMYDDCTTSIKVDLFTISKIDNPNLKTLTKLYNSLLKKYNEDYKKYKEDLSKFKKDLAYFELENDKYILEHSKQVVKKLEKKLKGKK